MADTKRTQPEITLKAAMESASKQVQDSPAWLKSIYERNEQLDRHRRRERVEDHSNKSAKG